MSDNLLALNPKILPIKKGRLQKRPFHQKQFKKNSKNSRFYALP